MAMGMGHDVTDEIVAFPRNLKERHDRLAEELAERADAERRAKLEREYAELDTEIRERLPDAGRYSWEGDEYVVIPAKGCMELVEEGRTLHHCVGSSDNYMRKMARGVTWILFLRRKEDPGKPYYTLEIEMGTDIILQWYSEYDRKPDEETVRKVIERFRKDVGKRRRKEVPPALAQGA